MSEFVRIFPSILLFMTFTQLVITLTNAWIFKNVHPLHDGWIPESQAARDELNFLGK